MKTERCKACEGTGKLGFQRESCWFCGGTGETNKMEGEQMKAEERLKTLMEKGYDIHIECKGKGRNYEMTYEASMRRSTPNPEDESDFSWLITQSHAVGNTLDELVENLEKNLRLFSGK